MSVKCSAVVRCDCCGHTFPENMILWDGFNYAEVCPFCHEEDCFTIIYMGD
jgi:hypothetical protein